MGQPARKLNRWAAIPVAPVAERTRGRIVFGSKLEARYWDLLVLRCQPGGDVHWFLRQVPFHLPGGTVYRVDFQEFHRDGSVHFVDPKGRETPEFKIKKREVEAIYPVTIEIVTAKDLRS